MNAFKTGIMSILYFFIGTPFLIVAVPLLIRYWMKYLYVKDRLKGKVVLVTGASSGLGEALCHELYRKGCKLILAARRIDQLERVKSDLLALTCAQETYTPQVLKMDISELVTLPSDAVKALNAHGRIDILINNAGVSCRGGVSETTMDVHKKIMVTNYFGTICLTKALLPGMIAQKSGQIVMINSVQGKIAIPFRSAYSASKHALQAYSDSLRAEIDEAGVGVLVVNPGYINTAISLNALTGSGSQYAKMDSTISEGYSPEEVAKRIVSAINYEEKEVIIAPAIPQLAILIRTLIPSLYFLIMKIRAGKEA